MKEYLLTLARSNTDLSYRRNLAREYLQARVLESLQRSGAMIPMAFHGGTALRFLYGLTRFSEDLDFALEKPSESGHFQKYLQAIRSTFQAEGYNLQIKVNDRKTVISAFVRFYSLPYDLEISPNPNEALSIKIELDTRPPEGAVLETDLVRRHITLRINHHDRATLFAGKLHAILHRKYAKGRDLFDLMWYLSDPTWPEPNLVMLNNALVQTGWLGPGLTGESWRSQVLKRLDQLNWKDALADVRPFLERPQELELLTRENFSRLLRE